MLLGFLAGPCFPGMKLYLENLLTHNRPWPHTTAWALRLTVVTETQGGWGCYEIQSPQGCGWNGISQQSSRS